MALALQAGEIFDRYEIVGRIKVRGNTSVYRARHATLGSPRALKVFASPDSGLSPEEYERFGVEGAVMGKVSDAGHPHIVRVYDAGIFNGQPFIAMELLDGQDLYDAVHTNTDPLMPLRATLQTLSALEFIHAMHVVHRDVKPGNIRITTNQGAKLMDFGIAKELNFCRGITTRYGVDALGTESYMAPEQLASLIARKDRDVTGEVNHLTDLWAMGKTLHFGLTGNHSIPKASTTGERYHALYHFVPSPPTHSGLYADCYPFLSRLMARKREDRYQDAASASRDLQQILDSHETRTHTYPDLPTMITHLVTDAPVEDVLRPSYMLLRPDVYTDLTGDSVGWPSNPHLPKLIVSRGSGKPLRVGRDSGLEMVITHPGVSRHHLDIMTLFERHDGPVFLIRDQSGHGFGVSSPGQQISPQRYREARVQAGALISLKEDVHMVITAPRQLRGKVREHLRVAPDLLQRLETIAHRQSS